MNNDKEKYEQLIIKSPLFTIDRQLEPSRYNREKYRFVEYLYSYLLAINEKKYERYSYEIFMVAEACIKAFDPAKGEFLHYFNAAWKQEQKHILGDEDFESQYRGIKIKETDIRKVKQIKKVISKMGVDVYSNDVIKVIETALRISKDDAETYFEMITTSVSDGYVKDSDGNEYNLIDQIADVYSTEDIIAINDRIESILDTIQEVYDKQQDRIKPIISDYITTTIYPVLKTINNCRNYSFFSDFAIYVFNTKGCILTKRDISIRYNRNETSINRTIKNFINELINEIEKE